MNPTALFTGTADLGLDRFIVSGSGPVVAGIQAVFGIDLNARVEFDPTSAPAPTDPQDPRYAIPEPLPHNAGQQLSYAGKLIIPGGRGEHRAPVRALWHAAADTL